MEKITGCALLSTSLTALLFDLRSGRIPNAIPAASVLAALIARISLQGPGVLGSALAGLFLPFALLFPLFRLGMTGAGDVKLLMALGSWLSVPALLRLLFLSLVFGGLFSLLLMLRRGNLRTRFRYFLTYLRSLPGRSGRVRYVERGALPKDAGIRLAVPVFFGVLITAGGMILC